MAAVYPLRALPLFRAALQGSGPVVVADVDASPVVDDDLKQLCRESRLLAYISVPVVRRGELVGILCLTQATPRAWTALEVALMQETAERTWAAVERARAEDALRQSEEQFRLLVTATSDTVYRMGADWTQMEQLIGKDFLADTLGPTRTWVDEYIPAEDLPPVQAAIAAAIGQKKPFELEHRVRRADGTVGWTHSRAVPMLNERGELLEWLGTATDITARKQAEEALRRSEERLRRMMNVPRVGLLTFSFAGALLTANDAFLDLIGYDRAEFEARTFTWQDFTPPEYAAESQRQFERVQRTGLGGPYEKEYLRRDGSRQWLMFVAAALGDGTLVKYAVDISARKQAEAGLRESEQRQRVLIENLPGAAVFVVDRALRYQLAEGEALRQTGFEPADFLGRTVRDVTPPAQWPAFQARYEAALAGHPFAQEHAQSGRIFLTRGVPLPGPAGQPAAVLAVSYDITDRKAAEEALRVSEAKYRTLFETMDQGFGVGEVLPAGPGGRRSLAGSQPPGGAPDRHGPGRLTRRRNHAHRHARAGRHLVRALRTGGPYRRVRPLRAPCAGAGPLVRRVCLPP